MTEQTAPEPAPRLEDWLTAQLTAGVIVTPDEPATFAANFANGVATLRAHPGRAGEATGSFWIVEATGHPVRAYEAEWDAEEDVEDGQLMITLEAFDVLVAASAIREQTSSLQLLVTLTVAPELGQTPADARAKMLNLFREYLTSTDSVFRSDYGASVEELAAWRTNGEDEPTWGGYPGPFVLEASVQPVDKENAA